MPKTNDPAGGTFCRFRATVSLGLPVAIALTVALPLAVAWADGPTSQPTAGLSEAATMLDKPLSIYLVQTDKTIVRGQLVAYDSEQMKINQADGSSALVPWAKLTPMATYGTRRRLIDPNDARAHFELGVWCWNSGLKTEATAEFGQARKIEPSFAEKVQQVYDGKYHDSGATTQVADVTRVAPPQPPLSPPEEPDDKQDRKVKKINILSEAESKAALEETRKAAIADIKTLGIPMRVFESKHFLIFSNWPKQDDDWLKDVHEKMYRGLANQFGLDPDENIWYGKMPIFAFDTSEQFLRYAKEIDKYSPQAGTAGYARSRSEGRGHIAIWRCGDRKQLSSLIVHEGTHAFLARYRSNVFIVSWLNEGLAQMMEEIGVQGSNELARARASSIEIARDKVDISSIFTNRGNIPFSMYPVALTITDMLLKKSKTKYVSLINDIKDGMAVDEALKKNYDWTYSDLEKYWTRWAAKNFK